MRTCWIADSVDRCYPVDGGRGLFVACVFFACRLVDTRRASGPVLLIVGCPFLASAYALEVADLFAESAFDVYGGAFRSSIFVLGFDSTTLALILVCGLVGLLIL